MTAGRANDFDTPVGISFDYGFAAERARKRLDLLAAIADLRKVVRAVARKTKPVRGADKIGLATGAVLNRHKVAKDFILTDDTFGFERNAEAIEAKGAFAMRQGQLPAVSDDAYRSGKYFRQAPRDLGSRGRWVPIENCLCRDQYAGEAIAALAGLFIDKSLL